ncbi:MAG: hypothetical protein LAT61_04710 [Alcanivorax sp.]|nr:hypothetical protein [Alcanivorax sp.]
MRPHNNVLPRRAKRQMPGAASPFVAVMVAATSTLAIMGQAHGMEPLDDAALQAVAGQDGLVVAINAEQGISAEQVRWETDAGMTLGDYGVGGANASDSLEASLILDGVHWGGIDSQGTSAAPPALAVRAELDVGVMPGGPALGVRVDIDRARLLIDDVRHDGLASASFGSVALDSSLDFEFAGMIDHTRQDARLRVAIEDGTLFYRQGGAGASELLLDDLVFRMDFDQGTVGIDEEGLIVSAPQSEFAVFFDLKHRADPGADPLDAFRRDDARGILGFGWEGTVEDLLVRIGTGGAWYNGHYDDPGQRSDGLQILMQHDHGSDYAWVIGEAGSPGIDDGQGNVFAAPRTLVRFDNWQRLDGAPLGSTGTPSFRLPLTIDVLNAGQGTGGLCFGADVSPVGGSCSAGELIEVPVRDGALAVMVRDAFLHAYPTRVYVDVGGDYTPGGPVGPDDDIFNWGLITTLGDMDADIVLYPGAADGGRGLHMDAVVTVQSHGSTAPGSGGWQQNTHLMIADTDPAVMRGIGLVNANLLLSVEALYLDVTTAGISLTTDQGMRLMIDGLFAGGDLDSLERPDLVEAWRQVINLEAQSFRLDIAPGEEVMTVADGTRIGNTYLAFSGHIRLDEGGGTYISLAEPNYPDVDLRLANMRGDIAIDSGRLDLLARTQDPFDEDDPVARLVISADLLLGRSAGLPNIDGREAALSSSLQFGGTQLMDMVIPGGGLNVSIGLRK